MRPQSGGDGAGLWPTTADSRMAAFQLLRAHLHRGDLCRPRGVLVRRVEAAAAGGGRLSRNEATIRISGRVAMSTWHGRAAGKPQSKLEGFVLQKGRGARAMITSNSAMLAMCREACKREIAHARHAGTQCAPPFSLCEQCCNHIAFMCACLSRCSVLRAKCCSRRANSSFPAWCGSTSGCRWALTHLCK